MHNKRHSTDGFVLRRRQSIGGERPRVTLDEVKPASVPKQFLIDPTKDKPVGKVIGPSVLDRSALSGGATRLPNSQGSLTLPSAVSEKFDLEDDTDQPKAKKTAKRRFGAKKIVKWTAIFVFLAVLISAGYFAYKFLATSGKIFKGNPIAALFSQAKELKADADGQTNILLFGTSEDDPGHDAPDLTDSIMIASINQKKKTGFIVSLARDLYVKYDRTCLAGNRGKINSLYSCVKNKSGEEAGALALAAKAGQILGLNIQYYTHVNYTVLRESVDAVGGITVNIESNDKRGILDSNFDWKCGSGDRKVSRAEVLRRCPPEGHFIQYPNGPANLDGEHALYLAQARGHGALTYGLSRSNPDRQDNQRKILLALKDKAVTAGVLTNPIAVNNLLETLGNNLRTNFDAEEVKTLISLGKDIKSESIASVSLENPDHPLATVSCFSGNVCPNKGSFEYGEIQSVIDAYAKGNTAALEYAKIDVLNASGVAGMAQTKAEELDAQGLKVTKVGNAPASYGSKPVQFYDLSGGKKPETLKKLESLLGVKVTSGVPTGVNSNADFVVIIGKPAETKTQ
jgi:anionic cell wall polymer biosynthesis LytR-Cps2A-Psr (LCP) family protein